MALGLPLPENILTSIDARGVALIGLEDAEIRRVLAVLQDLEVHVLELLRGVDFASAKNQTQRIARLRKLLSQTRASIGRAFHQLDTGIHGYLEGVASTELAFTNRTVGRLLQPLSRMLSANTVVVSPGIVRQLAAGTVVNMGESFGSRAVAGWLSNQNDVFVAEYSAQVIRGIQIGQGVPTMVSRLRSKAGVMGRARHTLEMLVRTSTQAVVSESRRRVYGDNTETLQGIYQLTQDDDRTTEICLAYSNKAWRFTKGGDLVPVDHSLTYAGGVPRHPNCRSVDMPWVKSLKQMGITEANVAPRFRSIFDGSLPAGRDGMSLLKAKPGLLRGRRGQLVRSGQISLDDLINRQGGLRTVKQLNALVARRARG